MHPVGRVASTGIVARPALFDRIGASARVTVVSGPPGSGKTVLLRSWADRAGPAGRIGWATMGRDERDPQRFWLSVIGALRRTQAGAQLVRPLTPAPGLDGWAMVERLLEDLASLRDPVWLVLDDVHELDAADALRQLELLVLRGPRELRFVLAARDDLRLGFHRLRLEGALREIRGADLRFTPGEAAELLERAGVRLSRSAARSLQERTEGWAAGLRLAALSLAASPDPERSAAEFSGSERTVAEYLLAEVLDRQPENVRSLLLRTSILESVTGELADLLTGDHGSERVLQDLEQANALTVAQDAGRTWFRYHQMFADLLQSQLRRVATPAEVAALNRTAAGWYAGHGRPVQAVRHAQAAGDWGPAARMLADHWTGLHLDGQAAVAHELLARFPAEARAADVQLAVLTAWDELAQGSAGPAQRHLERAEARSAAVPAGRREQTGMLLGVVRLLLGRQLGDLAAVAEQAKLLQAVAEAPDPVRPARGDDLHALCLVSLGIAEVWAGRFADAEHHLQQGLALARRIGRPHLEFLSLVYLALSSTHDASEPAVERSGEAMELAVRHGWTGESNAGVACTVLGLACAWQARLAEAEDRVRQAEHVLRAETEPSATLGVRYVRGLLELARGRHTEALTTLRSAESLAGSLAAPHYLLIPIRALLTLALVRRGELDRAHQALATADAQAWDRGELRIVAAALALARDDPPAALDALAPVADGSAAFIGLFRCAWRAQAHLLEAIARDRLGDPGAALALERALDAAETGNALTVFLLHPAQDLMERHPGHRTSHGALLAEIAGLLATRGAASPPVGPDPLAEPLSESELRVLRYLPTNLTAPEIAEELSVSLNTVKTHLRNLYAKLNVHRRTGAVERARALGLLARSGEPRRVPPIG